MKYIIPILLLFILVGCSFKSEKTLLEGEYLNTATKLNDSCTNSLIEFLSPMQLENESMRITDIYQLSIHTDTSIYDKDEFDRAFFIGLIFNEDPSNYEIYACYPETGIIQYSYLISESNSLIVRNNSAFMTDFKSIENLNCFNFSDSIGKYMEIPASQIGYWDIGGLSSINGQWLPDTVNHYAFVESDLNNIWNLQGDLEIKKLTIRNSINEVVITEQCDFERGNLLLTGKMLEYTILSVGSKAFFLFDSENQLMHRLNRK